MAPEPDRRWANIAGGIGEDGRIRPMSFDVLAGLAGEWAGLVSGTAADSGPAALLRTARSLFAHSWFDYEFMAVACLVGFQAMEAAFRVAYPDASRKPLRELIRRANREGILPSDVAELAETGAELRNSFSHPAQQTALTVGMAGPILENTHRLVALVLAAPHLRTAAGAAAPAGRA